MTEILDITPDADTSAAAAAAAQNATPQVGATRPVVPTFNDPMGVARRLGLRWRGEAGQPTLRHWHGSFWEHTGRHWEEMAIGDLKADLYEALENAVFIVVNDDDTTSQIPWSPNRKKIGDLVEALAATQNVHTRTEMPSWLDNRASAKLVACRNTLVDPVTRETMAHTPAYFNGYSLNFDYDPEAVCPRWDGFLESIWPGDQGSKDLLQEWFGCVIVGDFTHEKLMMIIGVTRSGKGTVGETLTNLLGKNNVSGPSLGDFTTQFGLQSTVGKPLAFIGDARNSRSVDINRVTEKMLSITSGDPVQVDRKNKESWNGKLNTHIMMAANQLLNFKDNSDAIMGRMLLLETNVSFLGREDKTLKRDLASEKELAGIFNWALEGYQRLSRNGQFTEPEASAELREEMAEKTNPMGPFIQEEIQQGGEVQSRAVYLKWLEYTNQKDEGRSMETRFGGDLKTALKAAGIQVSKVKRTVDGKRPYFYTGISLREPVPDFML